MTIRLAAALSLAALALAPTAAPARDARVGDIAIERAWTRATPPGARTAAGYLTLANRGRTPDRLVGASTPGAEAIEIHSMTMAGNVMRMRPVSGGVTLAPGKSVTLAPGGTHLMLIGVRQPLRAGITLPIELAFERAGRVRVHLDIVPIGATPGGGQGGHRGH